MQGHPKWQYRLHGVVRHLGSSPVAGHYIASVHRLRQDSRHLWHASSNFAIVSMMIWCLYVEWKWDKTSRICFALVLVTANLSSGLMLGAGGDTMTPKWTRPSMWTRSRSYPFITSSFQFQLGAGDWGEWQKRWLHLHLRAPAPVGSMDYLTEFVVQQNIF